VAGGAAGAGIGGRRNRTLGAILGGVAGAVVGSSIDKNNCRRQQNRWDGDGYNGW
jgi:outer membrane lipoprotein SlyB